MLLLALVAVAPMLSACGGGSASADVAASKADRGLGPIPTRKARARAVEPVAGESAAYAGLPSEQPDDQPATGGASASRPRASKRNSGPTSDTAISNAEVLKNGIALPPIEAPEPVRQIIEAGNQIARTPYLWGGGHGKWLDKGYDCSGSISFALASAGLLGGPLDSGRLMSWGASGKGKWITIYSNPGHVFMVVAGVRFDTSGTRRSGSRWQSDMRGGGGFVARHPPGL
jgi:cell wall-associated NlpC family hydrolase